MSHKTFSKMPAQEEGQTFIDCPNCGSSSFRSSWQTPEAQWQRCSRCSLVLQNPQPRREDIIKRYDDEYFSYESLNEDSFLELMLLGLKDIGFSRWNSLEKERKTFLDIGCATGRLGDYLNRSGWKAQGVEVCREAAAFGNKHYDINIFPGTVEEAEFPDESFYFVHNSHVIEHINRPDLFMKEIHRILEPGGYYLCATPNCDGFQAKLFGSRWRSVIADHLFLFSKKTLRSMAEKNGFAVRQIRTWGGLGAGYAPGFIKKPVDRLVKLTGWGDVMMMVLQKLPDKG
ncbi:MAG: class I SAM-dependent methyltransferase [Spirochaetales bacterium]|nr:class I SAM-dependent methyltransferase [Spirochaetales bacterium]